MTARFALLACAALATACSHAPRSGPLVDDIRQEAAEPVALPFALVEVDATIAARLRGAQRKPGFSALSAVSPMHGQRIRAGDRVQITLYEATGGGLFGGGPESAAGVRALPAQTVSPAGRVRIPYAGNVGVSSLSPQAAAQRIEAALAGQAIEPQAVVSVVASPAASVSVLGDAVAKGGVIPLSGTGERVLDMVAAAGGLTRPIHESRLRLTRRADTRTVDIADVLAEPSQNVAVRPRDVISVEHRPRYFTVLGAVGENARLAFDRPQLSVADGLSRARGLVDSQADPGGVFIVRYEEPRVLTGLPSAQSAIERSDGGPVPTVYRFDLSKPSGLLLAKRVPLREDDTLYVANAELNSAEKILRVVGLALQPVTTGAVIGNLAVN